MTSKPVASRRKFLATLGAGGVATVAVAVTQRQPEPAAAPQAAAPQGKGYQLTEHVRNYYRTAKV